MVETKKKENGRVISFVIAPTMFVSMIMAFVLPDFRLVGALYFLMCTFSVSIFSIPKFREEIIGIKKQIAMPLLIGAGTGLGFFIISKFLPSFSLLTPTLSLSISEDVRFFVIVFMAPMIEEAFRSASIGFLDDTYHPKKFMVTNILQAIIFASLHVLVYGVALGAFDRWIQVFGALTAISGSLIAAFSFGMLSGFIMKKTESVIPSIVAHMIINFAIVSQGLVVVALALGLI